ncbi:MAG TPA: cupredoxin domain-containing protein [Polyangia bacterium]
MKPLFKFSVAALSLAGASHAAAAESPRKTDPRIVQISITDKGFEPAMVSLKKGEPVRLVFTRKTERTCATSVEFDEPKVKKELLLNQPVEVILTPSKSGDLTYGCAMDKMVGGKLHIQ